MLHFSMQCSQLLSHMSHMNLMGFPVDKLYGEGDKTKRDNNRRDVGPRNILGVCAPGKEIYANKIQNNLPYYIQIRYKGIEIPLHNLAAMMQWFYLT